MRKVLLVLSACSIFLSVLPCTGQCRPPRQNLYTVLEGAKQVNVYIGEITDSSGQAGDMIAGIRENLEKELKMRLTINFALVEEEKDAALIIRCDINERIWLENDPIDQVHGIGAIAADAALQENYGRIAADFIVEKGPKKKVLRNLPRLFKRRNVLFDREVSADITRGDMPEEESKPLLEERLPEVFMRKCFSKNAKMD